MAKRYFTLGEANEQIARLDAVFKNILQLRAQLRTVHARLEKAGFAPKSESFDLEVKGAPPEVLRDRATFRGLIEAFHEELETIQGLGCEVKDLESGLVDWPAQHNGRDILLCWRYGEKEVAFWHDLEAGFAGRRPLSEL